MKKVNPWFWVVLLGLLSFGLLLTIWSAEMNDGLCKSVITNLAAAFIITAVVEIINEYILLNQNVRMILAKIKLKNSIDAVGLEEAFLSIRDVDYRQLIRKANNIDIIHNYGLTWTNNNIDAVRQRVMESDCAVRVLLLDPKSKFIPALAEQYGYTEDILKSKIGEAVQRWSQLNDELKKNKKEIDIYYHQSVPSIPIYRFDDTLVLVFSRLNKEKFLPPAAVYTKTNNKEDVYSMYLDDIEKTIEKYAQQI